MTRSGARRLVVDRREGEMLVVELEDGTTLDLPAWLLPAVGEGDVVWLEVGKPKQGSWRIEARVDAEAAEAARAEAAARLERLRARDPGGDVAL